MSGLRRSVASCAGGGTPRPSLAAETPASAVSPTSSAYHAGARSIPSWRGRSEQPTRSISSTPTSTGYPCDRRRRRARAAVTGCGTRIPSTCGSRGVTAGSRSASCTSSAISSITNSAVQLGNTWASGHHEAFADWRDAAAGLPSRAPAGTSRSRRRYFDSAKEVWARGYAQATLIRSDDPVLRRHVEELIEADDVFVWPSRRLRRGGRRDRAGVRLARPTPRRRRPRRLSPVPGRPPARLRRSASGACEARLHPRRRHPATRPAPLHRGPRSARRLQDRNGRR